MASRSTAPTTTNTAVTATGAGDPARTLALLWRHRGPTAPAPQRGPRPALNLDAVIEAAIALADTEGIEAVSMRRLAQHFEVAPMALYTYVPGKAELLDLMLDTVYAAMPRSTPRDGSWLACVEAVAHDNRALHEQHPWLGAVSTHRPPLGPGVMAKYEYELRALEGTGLEPVELDAALTFVLGFVASCARAAADERAAERESLMGDREWWSRNEPLLAHVFDAQAFPTATRVGAAAGAAHGAAYSPQHAYEFGLARVLAGLSALVESKLPKAPPRAARKTRSARTAKKPR